MDSIVGGNFTVNFALIIGVGLSNLQKLDFTSSKNIFMVGFPSLFGLLGEL